MYVKRGDEVIRMKQFSTIRSSAFPYGNETSTVVTTYDMTGRQTRDIEFFDTRYFRGNLDDFIKFYEENDLSPECKLIERIDR